MISDGVEKIGANSLTEETDARQRGRSGDPSVHPAVVLLMCHVESGICQNREIVFDQGHEEGITTTIPRIVEFAEESEVPIAFMMTTQSLLLSDTNLDGFTVGLHVHPKDEALRRRLEGSLRTDSDCLRDYAIADQRRLIGAAGDAFVARIGKPPRVFVAGNWSENGDTLHVLEEFGFQHDGSSLPGHSTPCADWSRLRRLAQPYRPSRSDYQSEGDMPIVHVPVYQGLWGDYLTPELLHLLGPSYFKAALREASVGGARVVHVYFHSPMALDPWFLSTFREVIDFARDVLHARFVRPQSISAHVGPPPRPFPPSYYAHMDLRRLKSIIVRRFPTLGSPAGKSTRQLD